MNPNIGGPFHPAYDSSTSSDDENVFVNALSIAQEQEEMIIQQIAHNNMMIARYLASQNQQVVHVGSIPGHIVINRDREAADRNLFEDYFAENPRYNGTMFRRRFRMSRSLFLRIVDAVKAHDNYFEQRYDALGRPSLSTLQEATSVFRVLAYGMPADATDEYVKIGESTTIECVKRFCRAVVEIFSEEYLRAPNANDVARLLEIGEKRGFPGMFGSLDYMHWKLKNCLTA